jgi:CRP-like cAMP-binding protein
MNEPGDSSIYSAFRHHIESMVPVSTPAWALLTEAMKIVTIKKGDLLLKEGEVCKNIYFIYKGAFRFLYLKHDSEVTTALYADGVCMTDMKSLATKQPSTIFIETLEDATIVKLNKNELIALYDSSPELQGIGRVLTEYLIAEEVEWREIYTIFRPEDRYKFILKKAPQLLQKVPLQYVASYLGMRRETLSRIRSKAARAGRSD